MILFVSSIILLITLKIVKGGFKLWKLLEQ